MATVTSLEQWKQAQTPHTSGEAFCMTCDHNWVAVAPVGTVDLECPACHSMKGKFKFHHLRVEDDHWTCNCGNQFFHVTKKGTYCPNCGEWQYPNG